MLEERIITQVRPSNYIQSGFIDFIWWNKWNRSLLLFAVITSIAQFAFFKFLYPYANYFVDSYYYLEAAHKNVDVNTWPVAYSKFLRIFSAFTHSDTILVGFQYFLIQFSGLLLLYSSLYFFKPGKIVTIIILAFLIFNPAIFYISNYISADAIFIGLSLLWVAQLIWIICRPAYWQIFTQALLLIMVFTIRYNAIYYPIITAIAFILSQQPIWSKVSGIALGFGVVAFSVFFTSNKMLETTGHRQFSAFGGWQLANNALYGYEHVKYNNSDPIPLRFSKLERMVRQHMDTLHRIKFTHEDTLHTFFYLWSDKGPLVQYMEREWKKDSTTPYFTKWAAEGPLFADYGVYLIKKHPIEFAQYFILPNSLKYITPPIEFLGVYNMGEDSVERFAKDWFHYKSKKIRHYYKDNNVTSLQGYPIFAAMVNLFLIISLIGAIIFKGYQRAGANFSKVSLLVLAIWLLNICFSILASPIVLRYQIFPIILCFIFSMLTIRFVDLNK